MPLQHDPLRKVPQTVQEWDQQLRKIRVLAEEDTVGTPQIQDNAVGNPELRDSAACSVIGRAANSQGDPGDIAASANGQFMVRRSNALVFDALADADLPSTIARDAEVATAISDHEAEADPHPQYPTEAEVTAAMAAAFVAHAAETNPHPASLLSKIYSGTGTPESVVTATRGALFLRTDGGAGTCFYVKESDTTNTGWVAK